MSGDESPGTREGGAPDSRTPGVPVTLDDELPSTPAPGPAVPATVLDEVSRLRDDVDEVERQRARTSITLAGSAFVGAGIVAAWFLVRAPGDFLPVVVVTLAAAMGSALTLLRELRQWNPGAHPAPPDEAEETSPRLVRERLAGLLADVRSMEGRPGIPRGSPLRPGLLLTVGGAAVGLGLVLLLEAGSGGWILVLPGLFMMALEIVQRRGESLRDRLADLEERIDEVRALLPPSDREAAVGASEIRMLEEELEAPQDAGSEPHADRETHPSARGIHGRSDP